MRELGEKHRAELEVELVEFLNRKNRGDGVLAAVHVRSTRGLCISTARAKARTETRP